MKKDNESFIAEVVEVDGELALDLPDRLIAKMGWKVGDTLNWEQVGHGWILSRVDTDVEE
jgi:hypothetical protein